MSKDKRNKTTFSPENRHKIPGRGKSLKTKLLEVIREEALLDLPGDATNEQAEKAILLHTARRAFDPDAEGSTTLLSSLWNKLYPTLKQVAPDVVIDDFPYEGTPSEKAQAVMRAIANGQVPPDVGATIISAAKDCIVIEEGTELKKRIEQIEEKLGI